jgi:hypothetical protein
VIDGLTTKTVASRFCGCWKITTHSKTTFPLPIPSSRNLADTIPMTATPQQADFAPRAVTITAGPRLRTAMVLAIVADLLQIVVFPFFIEGVESPADDMVDLCVGGILTWLLGWHWEFLPSFLAKLVPGVDMVPFWTLAVANVYRKTKPRAVAGQSARAS